MNGGAVDGRESPGVLRSDAWLATALAEDNYQRYSEVSNTGLSTLNSSKPFMTKMMM